MRWFIAAAFVLIVSWSFTSFNHAADKTPAKQFKADIVVTPATQGNYLPAVRHPSLTCANDDEASFLAGGDVQVEMKEKEYIPYGIQIRLKVHQLASGKLRVLLVFSETGLPDQADTETVLHEQSVTCVKEINAGDTLTTAIAGGRKLALTVTEVK